MLEAFIAATLEALARGDAPGAVPLTVLVRAFAQTGRDDIGRALGPALAAAAAFASGRRGIGERADWLRLLVEAAEFSDDVRLRHAAEMIAAGLESSWGLAASDAECASAVDAVLGACRIAEARRFASPAIDQLERLVTRAYEPGVGLQGRSVEDVVAVALALLTAFDVSGRLAYPMLAEEVMGTIRQGVATASPAACSTAARVFRRLALLYEDDGYRATAVVARDADYYADSRNALAAAARASAPQDRAAYALALTECGERSMI